MLASKLLVGVLTTAVILCCQAVEERVPPSQCASQSGWAFLAEVETVGTETSQRETSRRGRMTSTWKTTSEGVAARHQMSRRGVKENQISDWKALYENGFRAETPGHVKSDQRQAEATRWVASSEDTLGRRNGVNSEETIKQMVGQQTRTERQGLKTLGHETSDFETFGQMMKLKTFDEKLPILETPFRRLNTLNLKRARRRMSAIGQYESGGQTPGRGTPRMHSGRETVRVLPCVPYNGGCKPQTFFISVCTEESHEGMCKLLTNDNEFGVGCRTMYTKAYAYVQTRSGAVGWRVVRVPAGCDCYLCHRSENTLSRILGLE